MTSNAIDRRGAGPSASPLSRPQSAGPSDPLTEDGGAPPVGPETQDTKPKWRRVRLRTQAPAVLVGVRGHCVAWS